MQENLHSSSSYPDASATSTKIDNEDNGSAKLWSDQALNLDSEINHLHEEWYNPIPDPSARILDSDQIHVQKLAALLLLSFQLNKSIATARRPPLQHEVCTIQVTNTAYSHFFHACHWITLTLS